MFVDIGMNTSKPKNGDTTRFSITLYKDGKALETKLQCQVFGRGDDSFINPYELNMYIL